MKANRKLSRRTMMLTAGIFLIAATEGALARGGSSGGGMRGPAFGPSFGDHVGMTSHESRHGHDHDRGDRYFDKHKHKDHDKYGDKCKHPAPGTCGTNTIHPIITNPKPVTVPPPASPPGPIVRDHRPGGNAAGPVPGTIIRDHRNGADGKPVVVVSSNGGVTVTRPATNADLQKAGLLPKPAPYPVYVPIGGL